MFGNFICAVIIFVIILLAIYIYFPRAGGPPPLAERILALHHLSEQYWLLQAARQRPGADQDKITLLLSRVHDLYAMLLVGAKPGPVLRMVLMQYSEIVGAAPIE